MNTFEKYLAEELQLSLDSSYRYLELASVCMTFIQEKGLFREFDEYFKREWRKRVTEE
jgi:hypothetical protein